MGLGRFQVRRLSLGVSLLKNPSILFLDEVTSGLDSAASYQICDVLHHITQERKLIVVYTIHQPSTEVFEKFDELLLLLKGEVVYAGTTAGAEGHFKALGFPLPAHTNPSEHYM